MRKMNVAEMRNATGGSLIAVGWASLWVYFWSSIGCAYCKSKTKKSKKNSGK